MPLALRARWAPVKRVVARWFAARAQECCSCRDCDSTVRPWDDYCQNCGRHAPAQVSIWAGVYLGAALMSVGLIALAVAS